MLSTRIMESSIPLPRKKVRSRESRKKASRIGRIVSAAYLAYLLSFTPGCAAPASYEQDPRKNFCEGPFPTLAAGTDVMAYEEGPTSEIYERIARSTVKISYSHNVDGKMRDKERGTAVFARDPNNDDILLLTTRHTFVEDEGGFLSSPSMYKLDASSAVHISDNNGADYYLGMGSDIVSVQNYGFKTFRETPDILAFVIAPEAFEELGFEAIPLANEFQIGDSVFSCLYYTDLEDECARARPFTMYAGPQDQFLCVQSYIKRMDGDLAVVDGNLSPGGSGAGVYSVHPFLGLQLVGVVSLSGLNNSNGCHETWVDPAGVVGRLEYTDLTVGD